MHNADTFFCRDFSFDSYNFFNETEKPEWNRVENQRREFQSV